MKDKKQFVADCKENKELHEKFQTELNRLRADETLEVWQAVQKATLTLGYEITEEDAKQLVNRVRANSEDGPEELTDEEALAAAGGRGESDGECGCTGRGYNPDSSC